MAKIPNHTLVYISGGQWFTYPGYHVIGALGTSASWWSVATSVLVVGASK